jgi:predicted DNA-binding ribbon-helix-helix protein
MKSPVVKRSIVIAGHKTSVSLEDAFWSGLKEIAGRHDLTLSDMIAGIDRDRQYSNLSSAIRVFVLDHYRSGQEHKDEDVTRPETILAAGVARSEQAIRPD